MLHAVAREFLNWFKAEALLKFRRRLCDRLIENKKI